MMDLHMYMIDVVNNNEIILGDLKKTYEIHNFDGRVTDYNFIISVGSNQVIFK